MRLDQVPDVLEIIHNHNGTVSIDNKTVPFPTLSIMLDFTIYDKAIINGTMLATIARARPCNICSEPKSDAVVDCKLIGTTAWADLCLEHFCTHGVGVGLGLGQFLKVVTDES